MKVIVETEKSTENKKESSVKKSPHKKIYMSL